DEGRLTIEAEDLDVMRHVSRLTGLGLEELLGDIDGLLLVLLPQLGGHLLHGHWFLDHPVYEAVCSALQWKDTDATAATTGLQHEPLRQGVPLDGARIRPAA